MKVKCKIPKYCTSQFTAYIHIFKELLPSSVQKEERTKTTVLVKQLPHILDPIGRSSYF